jgi:hypothetical protein
MAQKPRITPKQIDDIISMRLSGLPVRETAKRVGVATKTVQLRYAGYLRSVADDRAEVLEHERDEAITRIERAAAESWDAWERSKLGGDGDPRFLGEYRQAMSQAERLRGLQVARVEHTGAEGGPIEVADARAALAERLAAIAPVLTVQKDPEF